MNFLSAFLDDLAQADPDHFWVGIAIAVVAGVVMFVSGFAQLRRARLMEDMPTSRVRSAAQGYVELQGHARLLPGPEIRSPLSNERCCWWEFKVEHRQTEHHSGKRRVEWVTIDKGISDELFLLFDDTGECVVDPRGATVIPSLSRTWRGHQVRPMVFPKHSSMLGFGDYRYTEKLVQFGDLLYALGQFCSQTAVRADDEQHDVAHLLIEWKRDRPELLRRFDTNRDGQIDLQEWEAARRAALAQVMAEHVERSTQPDLHVLSVSPDGRPFILSTQTEERLTRRLRWTGVLGVLLGMVTGAIIVYLLIARGVML